MSHWLRRPGPELQKATNKELMGLNIRPPGHQNGGRVCPDAACGSQKICPQTVQDVQMQPAGLKNRLPKTLHMSDILRHRFCFWHAGSSAPSQATCITKHTLLHLIWVCIHRCLSKSTCRYVCVTSCHAFDPVHFDSIPELLPGASLQLRVESSTCVSFFIHVHVGLCTSCRGHLAPIVGFPCQYDP